MVAGRLDALRDSPSSINLLAEVSSSLGPIPEGKGLEQMMKSCRNEFELGLYRHFYVVKTWTLVGSNHRPYAYQAYALTS